MKQFGNYQYVGGEMSERDKKEAGSKFWNKGKWDNYVLPFLPKDCKDMTLVDMGCNAGVFLKLAKDKGFRNVIGIDANREAIRKALAYKEENGGDYEVYRKYMAMAIDDLPVADYTVLANAHYYFLIGDWLEYLDKLRAKSRYVIIVTAQKKAKPCWASADVKNIRHYFRDWKEVGFVSRVSLKGDPFPRKLWGLCFENPLLERVPIDSLGNGNSIQGGFWGELDKGTDPLKTQYCRRQKSYRRHKWSERRVIRYMGLKAELYDDVKKNGLQRAIVIGKDAEGRKNRVIDGNHRHEIMRHLGYESIIIRRP